MAQVTREDTCCRARVHNTSQPQGEVVESQPWPWELSTDYHASLAHCVFTGRPVSVPVCFPRCKKYPSEPGRQHLGFPTPPPEPTV